MHDTMSHPVTVTERPARRIAEIAAGVINTAHRLGRPAVTTVGRIEVDPNFPAIVPAKVSFTIDARHPDPAARERLYAMHEGLLREVAARRSLDLSLWKIIDHPPCICDAELVATLRAAAADQAVPVMTMASGAGHDSQQMAAIAPSTLTGSGRPKSSLCASSVRSTARMSRTCSPSSSSSSAIWKRRAARGSRAWKR